MPPIDNLGWPPCRHGPGRRHQGWATVIPPFARAGGVAAALLISALAGLLPALKAARLSPTEALWSI